MPKIVLSKDAPEGQPLSAAFGPLVLDAGDAKSFETDDVALLEAAAAHPFFAVEVSKADEKKAAAAAEKAREAAAAEVAEGVQVSNDNPKGDN